MDFTLHTRDQEEHFTGEARYTFEGGFLVVHTGDGRKRTYSPGAWRYIDEAGTSQGRGTWVVGV